MRPPQVVARMGRMTDDDLLPSLPPQSSEGGAQVVAWLMQMDRDQVVGEFNEQIDKFNYELGSVFKVELCEVVSTMGRLVDLGLMDEDKKAFCVKVMGEFSRDYLHALAEVVAMAACLDSTLEDMLATWPEVSPDDDDEDDEEEDEEYYEDDYD